MKLISYFFIFINLIFSNSANAAKILQVLNKKNLAIVQLDKTDTIEVGDSFYISESNTQCLLNVVAVENTLATVSTAMCDDKSILSRNRNVEKSLFKKELVVDDNKQSNTEDVQILSPTNTNDQQLSLENENKPLSYFDLAYIPEKHQLSGSLFNITHTPSGDGRGALGSSTSNNLSLLFNFGLTENISALLFYTPNIRKDINGYQEYRIGLNYGTVYQDYFYKAGFFTSIKEDRPRNRTIPIVSGLSLSAGYEITPSFKIQLSLSHVSYSTAQREYSFALIETAKFGTRNSYSFNIQYDINDYISIQPSLIYQSSYTNTYEEQWNNDTGSETNKFDPILYGQLGFVISNHSKNLSFNVSFSSYSSIVNDSGYYTIGSNNYNYNYSFGYALNTLVTGIGYKF